MAEPIEYSSLENSAYRVALSGTTALPRLPMQELRRPRVIDLMRQDDAARIWVITAPAGFGKSVLAAQWAMQLDHPVAWFSLRNNDNQPRQFLAFLLTAISRSLGRPLMPMLLPTAPVSESVTSILDAVAELGHDITIVFDDLHAVEDDTIVLAIEQIFNQMPPNLRIVITSRTEPKPALARQRAHGRVIDIHQHDLSFDASESRAFLKVGMSSRLNDEQIDRVSAKTEGWVTGLSLFKLSVKNLSGTTIDRLLEQIEGGSGVIEGYLLEEVIRPLGPELRDFAVRASLLEFLDPDACNAVLGIENSRRLIRELERRNVFVIISEDTDSPPRFHHLFSEALRGLLHLELTDREIRDLHLRAARHFLEVGDLEGAARHAIAAKDWELATAVLTDLCVDLFSTEKTETLWYWLKQLPTDGLLAAGQLASWLAWSLAMAGKGAESLSILNVVEPIWRERGEWELVGEAALSRGTLAIFSPNEQLVLQTSLDAVTLLPDTSVIRKMQAWAYRSHALRISGDRDGAARAREQAHEFVRRLPRDQTWWFANAENVEPMWIGIEGRLGDAITYANHLLTLVSSPTSRDAMNFRNWIVDFHLERNELDEAQKVAEELLEIPPSYWNPARLYVHLSRIAWARGLRQQAFDHLDAAFAHARRENLVTNVQACEALQAWYWTEQGELFLASRWESAQRLEELNWVRKFNVIHPGLVSVRLAIASANLAKASRTAKMLLDESARRHRWGEMVRLHVMNAVAQQASGDKDGALSSLSWAVRLGHEGYLIRSFVDDGAPIGSLLSHPSLVATAPEYLRDIRRLLTVTTAVAAHDVEAETNKLTERELDILRLVAHGLSNQVIAERLFIAEPTVRKHLNNVYRKFGVANRTQAINRARQIGLI